MTHQERVQITFRHQEPDRVPLFEHTISSRVASEFLGRTVHTGGPRIRWEETSARWESEQAWQDYVGRLIGDFAELIRELDQDIVRAPWRHAARPSARLDDHTFRYDDRENDLWSVFHYDHHADVFHEVDSAIRQEGYPAIERLVASMERSVDASGPPTAESYADLLEINDRAGGGRFLATGDGFLMVPPAAIWYEAMLTRPDLIERYLDCSVRRALKAFPEAAALGIHGSFSGGDLAYSAGPIFSPALFRKLILPRLRTVVKAAHQYGLVYLYLTDGMVWPLAQELFVDSGVDGYGEIDIDAGMGLAEVKRSFPHLTLWGGISCGKTLTSASPVEVREAVRRTMLDCAPGGGLIFGSSNSIHQGVPLSNFVAMHEAALEFGAYRG